MIKEQDKIVNKLFSYSFIDLPHTICLQGDIGCGKHTLINDLADKHHVEVEDISDKLSFDDIMDIYSNPEPKFYIIDFISMDNRKSVSVQNSLLKLLEEPPLLIKLFILIEPNPEIDLLNTIKNRCQSFLFEPYSIYFLKDIANINDKQFDFFYKAGYNTPGKLLEVDLNDEDFKKLPDIINNIILNISRANVPNTLTLIKHIKSKENDTCPYTLKVFLTALENGYVDKCIEDPQNFTYYMKQYLKIHECRKKLIFSSNDDKILFENLLLELKGVV